MNIFFLLIGLTNLTKPLSKNFLIDSDITYDRKILEGNEAFLHPKGLDGYLLKFAEGSIFPEGRMLRKQTPKNVPEEFEKISLGDVKIEDQHGNQDTLTVHFFIPIVIPETCPWDVPYCTDVLAAANKMYPENQVLVIRKNDGSVTDERFISDKTMKKLIQEKLKDPKLTENQKKLLDRPYVRSRSFEGKIVDTSVFNATSYEKV